MPTLRSLAAVLVLAFGLANARADAPWPGDPAPPLTIEHLLNAPPEARATLDALRGKTIVLEFWATSCAPCIAAIPHMNELAAEFRDRDVVFIHLTDDDLETIETFQRTAATPIDGWIGIDPDGSTADAFAVGGIPHTVIIDHNGTIAAVTHPRLLTPARLERHVKSKAGQHSTSPTDLRAALAPQGAPLQRQTPPVDTPLLHLSIARISATDHAQHPDHRPPNTAVLDDVPVRSLLAMVYNTRPADVRLEGIDDSVGYRVVMSQSSGESLLRTQAVRDLLLHDLDAVASLDINMVDGFALGEAPEGHTLVSARRGPLTYTFNETFMKAEVGKTQWVADWVSRILGVPVEDRTGLDRFWFSFDFQGVEAPTVEALNRVLETTAGLRLEPIQTREQSVHVRRAHDAEADTDRPPAMSHTANTRP